MLTRRLALDLLHGLASPAGAGAIANALGFHGSPVLLDDAAGKSLSIPPMFTAPHACHGPGVLRALLTHAESRIGARGTLAELTRALARSAPHHAWLVVVTSASGTEAAIATWQQEENRQRICALLVDPRRPLDSDAETLMSLAASSEAPPGTPETLIHLRWCEILGREALSYRFYRALERSITALGEGAIGCADAATRRELALLATSRLLFLSFLQTRGWLDGDADFLVRQIDAALARRGCVHRQLLAPLFFGTLNTRPSQRARLARAFGRIPFLNGGLFARSPLERTHRELRFRDSELAALFDDVLTRYRFTTREVESGWSEAAIDPEMLGHAFESLMATRERRDSGAFYTPQPLVARVTDAALDHYLDGRGISAASREALQAGQPPIPSEFAAVRRVIGNMRVLDPACGTGAFLVHVLQTLATYLSLAGDDRPPSVLRRGLLTTSIFGVDVNPMAVWLCELRLWLSVVIDLQVDDPMHVPPLPNLDRNVRVGDALGGGGFDTAPSFLIQGHATVGTVARLRERYTRATGPRKRSLARALDFAERRVATIALQRRIDVLREERRALLSIARGRDLFGGRRGVVGGETRRLDELKRLIRAARSQLAVLKHGGALPFRFASHFADCARNGGFDVVVGNPPWVRLHRIPPERRDALRREFRVFRDAAWKRGADDAAAGAGFAAQVDLAALFTEQGCNLLQRGGVLALLLPVKLWRSLAGGGVRRLLFSEHKLLQLEDWSEAPSSFDAAVYPSLVVARVSANTREGSRSEMARDENDRPRTDARDVVRLGVHRRELQIAWSAPLRHVPLDDSPGAPWLLLPPEARRAFDRLSSCGPSLARSGLGRPVLGVKSGCNDAFLVRQTRASAGDIVSEDDGRAGTVEPWLLRPVLRGEGVRRWKAEPDDRRILWTHDDGGRVLRPLPSLAARWLGRWRNELTRRSDLRPSDAWWTLFRIDAAMSDVPRIVWADLSRGPRACILPAGSPFIPLNSCYVIRCRDDVDAAALATLLNSPLANALLSALAEPARGGFHRYLGWTVAQLPLPNSWERARSILAPLGARAMCGDAPSDAELLDAVVSAYRVRAADVLPIVEWVWR